MDIHAPISSPLSLENFENFIDAQPNAQSIIVSGGHIVEQTATVEDQINTKEAFKAALSAKYPDQVNLVDEAWEQMSVSGESWSSHKIKSVLQQAADLSVSPKEQVEQETMTPEAIKKISEALDEYAEQVVSQLSPEQQASLQEQLTASGLAVGGAGLVGLAANISDPATNAALAHLLDTITASLSHSAVTPMMGAAAPVGGHLASAVALTGSAAVAAPSIAALQTTIGAAAPTIATFLIAGAVAHRLFIAARRISSAAHRVEHEINSISVSMLSAAFATVPPAQHALLISSIFAAMLGQHMVDPGVVEQSLHNIRDAALGVYLFHHPEVAMQIAQGLESLLLSAGKEIVSISGIAVANNTATVAGGGAAATTTTVAGAASSNSAGIGVAHATSTVVVHHSIAATVGHGLSVAGTTIATIVAAHPGVVTAIIVGGACAAAYKYVSSSSNNLPQNQQA